MAGLPGGLRAVRFLLRAAGPGVRARRAHRHRRPDGAAARRPGGGAHPLRPRRRCRRCSGFRSDHLEPGRRRLRGYERPPPGHRYPGCRRRRGGRGSWFRNRDLRGAGAEGAGGLRRADRGLSGGPALLRPRRRRDRRRVLPDRAPGLHRRGRIGDRLPEGRSGPGLVGAGGKGPAGRLRRRGHLADRGRVPVVRQRIRGAGKGARGRPRALRRGDRAGSPRAPGLLPRRDARAAGVVAAGPGDRAAGGARGDYRHLGLS